MQVSFNPSISRISNNNSIKRTSFNNQISFGYTYNSHTKKSEFDKFIGKLGLKKENKQQPIMQVFEISPLQESSINSMNKKMINFYSEFCGIDPFESLFIASYKDDENRPVVVFNCFSTDENDNQKIQLFVIESKNEKLSSTQKAAYKIFYDNDTRRLFQTGSLNNPLRDLKSEDYSKDIAQKIEKIAKNIQNPTWAKYCANLDRLDPVIFSSDGKQKIWFNPKNI